MNQRVSIFKDRLAQMEGQAAKAMENYTPGGVAVPPGIYHAKIEAKLGEAKKTGNLMITRTFTIAEGEFKGLKVFDHNVLERMLKDAEGKPTGERVVNDVGVQQARRWFEAHGIEWPATYSAVEDLVMDINESAPLVEIKVTVDDKDAENIYTNVTVLKALEGVNLTSAQPATGKKGKPAPAPKETATPPAEAAEGASDAAEDDVLTPMRRPDLKKYILDNELGITVTAKMTDEDVRAAIREMYANAESAAEGSPTADELIAFAQSDAQGISEVEDGMERQAVIDILLTYQYQEDTLLAGEKDMLLAIGVPPTNIIAKPKPAPAAKPAAGKSGLKMPAPKN
jgi:hypothetical protein